MKDERIDEEILQVVNGLLVLPHHVLLRQLTYWSTDIDDGEYGIDPDHGREEWREITDCYATAKTEQQKYMYAGCMALKMGSMLQDIKQQEPNLFQDALHEVMSRKDKRIMILNPTMRKEIDHVWQEPDTWEEGRMAGLSYTHLVRTFMQQYEGGNMKETAGNVLYLLERIGKLWFQKPRLFDPSTDWKISSYEMLLEVSCYILDRIIHDKRTKVSLAEDIPWHLRTINMIYRRPFQSFNTSFDEFLQWGIRPEVFIGGYHYFMGD